MQLSDASLLRSQAFIGGRWCDAEDGSRHAVVDPAGGGTINEVPRMSGRETAAAIRAAAEALPDWRQRSPKARGEVIRRWWELVVEASDDLAALITAEGGKPLAEARGEVAYTAGFLEWFAGEARRAYGDVIPPHAADKRLLAIRQPIGVAAAITPWNFPAAMLGRKAAAALAAGCTLIAKPAPQTPLTALALAALAERAGLPAGVLNIVTSDAEAAREIGDVICASPVVRAISFTGSTAVGVELAGKAAATVKKVSLELGGNAPFVVFEDADLEAAVEGAMQSKFRNAGQTCVCANRFYAQESIAETFAERLAAAVDRLVVGPGAEPGVTVGPLIDRRALAKVARHVDDARERGGRILRGGRPHPLGGSFYEPTVIADANPEMLIAREETFGPVAAVFPFADDEQAIRLANATDYGLASYFYSQNVARVFRVAESLEYGMVGINTGMISTEVAPFGGVKASGLGREGGRYGMEEYQEIKYLCFGFDSGFGGNGS
jgi:succinate-semialdehyde dehydrogenase / glutarate-semialdehyde dehydrogenase